MSYKRVFGGLALSAAIGANLTGCAGFPGVPNPELAGAQSSPQTRQTTKAKPVLVSAVQDCHATSTDSGLSGGAVSHASVNEGCVDNKADIKPLILTVTEPGGQGGQGGNATAYPLDQKIFVGEAAEELGNRANFSGNIASIKACFKELGIEERPLMFINVTDAKQIVDCTDQKTLKAFWSDDPFAKRHEVANIVVRSRDFSKYGSRVTVAEDLRTDDQLIRTVANDCAQPGTPMTAEFVECASGKYDAEFSRQALLGILGIFGGVAVVGVGATIHTRRKNAQNAVVSNAQAYTHG